LRYQNTNIQKIDQMAGQVKPCIALLYFTFLFLIFSSSTLSQEFYWVNGSGNWNDPAHWSEVSGGPGGAGIPDKYNDVIIDDHSFSDPEPYIKITGKTVCKDLIWKHTSDLPTLKSGYFIFKQWTNAGIYVHGSVQIPEEIKNQYYGDLILKGSYQTNHIDIKSKLRSDIIFSGSKSRWILQNPLETTKDIEVKRGNLNTNDKEISCKIFRGSGSQKRGIDFGASKVKVEKWDFANTEKLEIDASNLDLNFKEEVNKQNFSSSKDIEYRQVSLLKSGFTISTSTDSATCWTTDDGSFTVSVVSGGLMPFDYILYDDIGGDLVDSVLNRNTDNHTFNNLYPGTYFVEVIDDGGIKQVQLNTVPPDTLEIDTIECIKALSCFNSEDAWFESFVSGGTPPYTYTWQLDKDLDGTFEITLGSDSAVVTDMAQGAFLLTVEDANSCPTRSVQKFFLPYAGDYSDSIPDEITFDDIDITPSCEGEDNGSITVSASGGTGEIDYFIVLNATLDSTYDPDGNFNNVEPGEYTIGAYDANNCENTTVRTVGVHPKPTADAGSDEVTCEGVDFDLSTSSDLPDTTDASSINWNDDGAPGAFNDPSLLRPVYQPAGGQVGNVNLIMVVQGVGACNATAVSDTMVLTINVAPSADAGSDEEICEGTAFDLSSSTTEPTASNYSNLAWDDGGAGGSFDDNTVLKPVYTPPAGYDGTLTLTLTASEGSCPDATDDMELTVTAAPAADAGSDEEICEGTAFDLTTSATEPSASDYSALSWDDGGIGGSFDDNTVLKPVYTPPAGFTGTLTLTLTANGNGSCSAVSDNMELTVHAEPTADAGSNEEICEGSIFDLSTAATEPSASDYSSLSWDDGGVGGSFDDNTALKPVYTPPSGYNGTITLTLTANGNGPCASVFDDMELSVTAAPSADAGSDEEICEGNPFDLGTSSIEPSASSYSSLSWDDGGAGGSFGDNTALKPVYTPPAGFTGTLTLSLTANGNGSCGPVTDDMQLTVTAEPSAEAGSDEETCENTSFDFTASSVQPSASDYSSLQWDDGGTGGSFDDNTALQPVYTPPAGYDGVITLTLTANGNGSCPAATDNMELTVTAAPTVDAGSDEETCEGTVFDFNNAVTEPTASEYSSLSWDDGGVGGSFDDNTTLKPVYTPPAGYTGTITLTLTANGNGTCANASDNMELTVTPEPTVDAGSDEETCENTSFDFSTSMVQPTASDYSILQWDDGGVGGSFDDDAALTPVYTPPTDFTGTITLTLTANGNANCSAVSDNMDLTITAAPVADAGSDEATCENTAFDLSSSSTQPTASDYSGLLWDDGGAGGAFDDNTALRPVYTPPADYSGTITLTLNASGNASCAPASDDMELTVFSEPSVDAGSDEEICENTAFDLSSSATQPTASDYNSLSWDDGGIGGSFDDNTALRPFYAPPADYSGTITLTLTATGNANCTPVSDNMELTVTTAPAVDAGTDEETCEGSNFDLSTSTGTPTASDYSSLTWDDGGAGGSFDDQSAVEPVYTTPPGFAGSITLTLTANGNGSCNPVSDNMNLTVTKSPTADAGQDTLTICYGDSLYLDNADTSHATSVNWTTGGDGTFSNSSAINPGYQPGTNDLANGTVTLFLEATGNGSCSAAVDSVVVIIPPELQAAIGSPRPFLIDENTTEVQVFIKVEDHDYIEDLSYYLVSPGGNKLRLASYNSCFTFLAGSELTFTGNAADTFDVCSDPLTGTYKLSGDRSEIDGEDPSNGAWQVRVEDHTAYTTDKYVGKITEASIQFTDDHDVTGDPVTVTYEGLAIDKPIREYSGLAGDPPAGTEYTVPYGLETTCYGSCDATAVVFKFGGTPPYTDVEWRDSVGNVFATGDTADLCAGKYYVEFTDALGCRVIDSVLVTQPPEIVFDSLDVVSVIDNNGCFGDSTGTVEAGAHGGSGTLNYALMDTSQMPFDTIATNTSGNFYNLPAGHYLLQIYDQRYCQKDSALTIEQPDSLAIQYESFTSLTDSGTNDGTINIYAKGGTDSLTYTLYDTLPDPDTLEMILTLPPGDTAYFTGLEKGVYFTEVLDTNNCGPVISRYFNISAIDIILDADSVLCAGSATGTVYAGVTGGVMPYTYEWTHLDTATMVEDTLKVLRDTMLISDTLRDMTAGRYLLNVTDSTGISNRDTIDVLEPEPIVVDSITPDSSITCFGEEEIFVARVSGGIPPYSVAWQDKSTLDTVSVNDTASLKAGTYYILVTDSLDCIHIDSVTITQPDSLQITGESFTPLTSEGATDGTIDIDATGGIPPLQYVLYLFSDTDTLGIDTTSDGAYSGLPKGNYFVRVNDAIGCDTVESSDIEISALNIQFDVKPVTCAYASDGSVTAELIGGFEPFTYEWTTIDGDTLGVFNTSQNINTPSDSLPGGRYILNVRDNTGNSKQDTASIPEPKPLQMSVTVDTLSGPGQSDGSLDITATGGNDSIFVAVDNLNDPTRSLDTTLVSVNDTATVLFSGLSEGWHEILVFDENNCGQLADTVNLTYFELDMLRNNISCNGYSDGIAIVQVAGGTPPFTYHWGATVRTDSLRMDSLPDLPAGWQHVMVEDHQGFELTDSVKIIEPTPIHIDSVDTDQALCRGLNHTPINVENDIGAIRLFPEGGTPYADPDSAYYYRWVSEGVTTPGKDSLTGIGGGNYQVTIIDSMGCTKDTFINVPLQEGYVIDLEFGGWVDSICYGDRVNLFVESAENADLLRWEDSDFTTPEAQDTLSQRMYASGDFAIEAKNAQCLFDTTLRVELYPYLGIEIEEQDEDDDGQIPVKENVSSKVLNVEVANPEIQATYSWRPAAFFDPEDSIQTELQVEVLRQQELGEQKIWIIAETRNCEERDSATVRLIPNVEPVNVFSPNDDSHNDTWRIEYAEQYDNLEVVIVNRWGVEVFQRKPYTNEDGWNGRTSGGKKLPSGTYYYIILTHENGIQPLSGTVTIIR